MTVRVRHVADVNPPIPGWERIPDDEELTFIPLEAVWPRRVDYSRHRPKSDTSTGYTRIAEGDVVVPKITPTFEGDRSTWISGMPTAVATCTTELHVVRSRDADPRYLDHLFSSKPFLEGGESEMIGVAGQKRVPDDWIRDFPVPVEMLTEQRAIADYLDAETARIDALIAKKQQLIHLLEERWQTMVSSAIWATTRRRTKVKYLAGLPTSGNRDHGSFTDDDSGVPCLRGLNIRSGRILRENLRFVSHREHQRMNKTQLDPGDIVIVRSGLAGSAAAIPDDLQPCNCVDLVVVKRSSAVNPRFLEFVINSREAQEQIAQKTSGALLTHFNAVDAGNLSIPQLPIDRQEEVTTELVALQNKCVKTVGVLERQVELLIERRQALITAAVTGELRVPGAP